MSLNDFGTDLETVLALYRDMKQELAPAMSHLDEIKRAIVAHVKETGETAAIDGASISTRHGYVRTSWDNKMLQGYALDHPEINAAKTEKEIGPAVTIKVD